MKPVSNFFLESESETKIVENFHNSYIFNIFNIFFYNLGKGNGENQIYLSDLETDCFHALKTLRPPKEVRGSPYVFVAPYTRKYR